MKKASVKMLEIAGTTIWHTRINKLSFSFLFTPGSETNEPERPLVPLTLMVVTLHSASSVVS